MKMTTAIAAITAITATFLGLGFAHAGGEGWTHDFAAAKKQAAAGKMDLLLDFTGSDWCPPCKALTANILSKDEFHTLTKDKLVLVELDFPQNKSKLSDAIQAQNMRLQDQYAISGYPTILLCDADGRPYAATGFQEGGPKEYVAHLDQLRTRKDARDKAFAEASKAEGLAKAKALIAALDAMELEDATIAKQYPDEIEQIKAADPKGETGYARKLAAIAKYAAFESEMGAFFEKRDMEGALALVGKAIASGEYHGETQQKLILTKASVLASLRKFDEALKAVDEARAAAPDSELAGEMEGIKAEIEQAKGADADKPTEMDDE